MFTEQDAMLIAQLFEGLDPDNDYVKELVENEIKQDFTLNEKELDEALLMTLVTMCLLDSLKDGNVNCKSV